MAITLKRRTIGIPDQPITIKKREPTIPTFTGQVAQKVMDVGKRTLTAPLKPPSLLPPIPKKIQQAEDVSRERIKSAFKVGLRHPETFTGQPVSSEELTRTESLPFADIIRETYPSLKKAPKKEILLGQTGVKGTLKQFPVELGGSLLEMGLDPSTFIQWYGAQKIIPMAAKGIFKALPPKAQEFLTKQRTPPKAPTNLNKLSNEQLWETYKGNIGGLKPKLKTERFRDFYKWMQTKAGQYRPPGLPSPEEVGKVPKVAEKPPTFKGQPIEPSPPGERAIKKIYRRAGLPTTLKTPAEAPKPLDIAPKTPGPTITPPLFEGKPIVGPETPKITPEITKPIPSKGIDPLTEKAKKYKTAEEFVSKPHAIAQLVKARVYQDYGSPIKKIISDIKKSNLFSIKELNALSREIKSFQGDFAKLDAARQDQEYFDFDARDELRWSIRELTEKITAKVLSIDVTPTVATALKGVKAPVVSPEPTALVEEAKKYKSAEVKKGEKIYKMFDGQEYYSIDKGFSWKPVLEENIEVIGKRLGKTKGKHGTYYNIMPDLESRYPEYKGKLEEKQLTIGNVLKVEKITDETYPVKDLFYRWFNEVDLQNEMQKSGLDVDEAMDKMVSEEAIKRGYDAVQFGNQEIVDLRDADIYNKATQPKAGGLVPKPFEEQAMPEIKKRIIKRREIEKTKDFNEAFAEAIEQKFKEAEKLLKKREAQVAEKPAVFKGQPIQKKGQKPPQDLFRGQQPTKPGEPSVEAWQIEKADKIAEKKALISEKGKYKPQYRRLALQLTGKKDMRQMTRAEARTFIDALYHLSMPSIRQGKVIPPSVPTTKALTTQHFFQQKFREPTFMRNFTDQVYYAQQLGVKPLVEPLEIAKQRFDLVFREQSNNVKKVIAKINKEGKTSPQEIARAKIKNTPTKAVYNMRELLDTHEEAPAFLSPKEKEFFNYFRSLSRTILDSENQVLKSLGMEPIKYRKAYVRHIADSMAMEMLSNRYPFPQGLYYWAKEMVGKKVYNPMELQRKLADDLEELWTKDLEHATNSMLWTGLKVIYLSQPLQTFNRQLGAISKDKAHYDHLTPKELELVQATTVIPARTKEWLINYVNNMVKGQETNLDESINKIVTGSGLKGLFNKILSPFGRTLGRKPLTDLFQFMGRLTIHGVMGPIRPKQLIRNKFQLTQNLGLYTIPANLKGFLPATERMKRLMDTSLFLKTYTGFEELPQGLLNKLETANLAGFQWSAISNVKQTMKVSYWDTMDLIANPKYKEFGWSDPQRTYEEPPEYLYPSERTKIKKEMEFGGSATQYHYIPLAMPEVFRHKALTPLTRLQSWWMNHFFKFNREMATRAITGKTSYGAKLPWSRRIGYLRYLILGGIILNTMGYARSFMFGAAPTAMPPIAALMIGMYTYGVNRGDSDWEKRKRAQAKSQIFNSLKTFIPGYLAYKDINAVWEGRRDLSSLFFYTKIKKRKEEKRFTGRKYQPRKIKRRSFKRRKFSPR